MIDPVTVVLAIFAAVTLGSTFQYYRLIRRAGGEYNRAKEALEDIVLSFNRQLRRENEKLEVIAYKVESAASKSEGAINRANEFEKRLQFINDKVLVTSEDRNKILAKVDEVDTRVRDAVASRDVLLSKITDLESKINQPIIMSEGNVGAVIPIRRDKALAPLTPAELSALEFLASEGPKTAPDVKWRIRLSREHTARLMKRLYESGYLERDTNRIPFRYSIKKEMEDLLKKTGNEAA